MSAGRKRSGRDWRATAILLALTASVSPAAQTPDTQSKPVAVAVGDDADATPSLSDVIIGMETMDASAKQLASLGADTARIQAMAAQITEIEQTFSGNGDLASDVRNDVLGFHELLDLGNNLRLADLRLGTVSEDLASKAEALDAALDDVDASTARVVTWTQAAKKRAAPPALQQRIQALIPSQEALRGQLLARRDEILEVLSRTTHLQGRVSSFRDEVTLRSDQLATLLRTERSEPIWRIEPKPAEWRRVAKVLAVVSGQILFYLRDHVVLLLTVALLTLVFTYLLIVATRAQLAALADSDSYGRRVSKLFEKPMVAAVAAMLGAISVFSSDAPSGYQHLLWALLPLPGVLLARAVFGPGVSLSLYALAAAAIAQELIVPILEPLPIASRLILIAQCGGLAAALGLDLHHRRFASAFPGLPAVFMRWLVAAIIGVLFLAVLATVIGQIGAARVLRSLVLGALDLLLVLSVAAGVLFGMFLALMHTSTGQRLRIVREYQDELGRFTRTALMALAVVAWICGLVFLLGLGDEVSTLGGALHNAEIKIGSISIQMVAVWAGLAVLLVTFLVVKIVSPLLEVEILPRFTRKQGLPFAVATVSRYLIVTAGVLLAMAAMGADLTKVSLLAGALGVGIGFGLQGVVNNFVSGLILLLERPVSVGDIIEMGELSGVVERIGVRSSTVRTPQGAEVILPNGDLISKEVTNWTLSDRKKLVEIDIDIAEWSEPEKVVSLLQAAASDVAGVMASPPPVATFSGGSTGSLIFSLEAWIDDYARGRTIESALRMAVVKKLAQAGIGIPAA